MIVDVLYRVFTSFKINQALFAENLKNVISTTSSFRPACMDARLQGCRAFGELSRAVVEPRLERAAEVVERRREQAAEESSGLEYTFPCSGNDNNDDEIIGINWQS